MDSRLKILMVEDLSSDADLIKREIKNSGFDILAMVVETKKEYIEALNEFNPDIILSDYSLPTFDGRQALRIREEQSPHIPFILVTGSNNEETAVECMKAGADDYILKDNLKRLGQALKAALEKKAIVRLKKEAEEKLSVLSRAVEQNPALILIAGIDGKIEYVNKRFTETTGYSLEEVLGKNPRILNSGNQSIGFYKDLWNTVLSGKEWNGEIMNLKKNGDIYWENMMISPMVNETGQITHLISISEDVTEKRRMVEDLIAAKNKAEATDKLKTAFINNISHEVRTPLNGIIGFSEMMTDEDLTVSQKETYNEIIKKCGSRLLGTINNYMDSSLIVSGNMEAHSKLFSLDNLLAELKAEFSERCTDKGIDLFLQKPARIGDILINTDQELLRKIVSHLLDNAVKFTEKGSISFGFRYKPGIIEFFVSDSGSGIERNQTEDIFDYFTQADTSMVRGYEGSGLGLSIARGLLELLGGQIRVESVQGKGSSFYFTLPDSLIGSVPVKEVNAAKPPERETAALILVAEDDEFNYKYLEITLKRAGYLVIHAENGQVAVEICHRNSDVNLILMDMKMPVMGGLEATTEIRTFLPKLPIIAQTAYVSSADENEAYQAGCNEFLSKPVNKDKLLAVLQKFLVPQE